MFLFGFIAGFVTALALIAVGVFALAIRFRISKKGPAK